MKKKYDCSITLDCIHELKRFCNSYFYSAGCENCPFSETDCNFEDLDDEKIFILQQWSDNHPETPRLTKKEFDFLNCFQFVKGMCIFRPTIDSLAVEKSDFEVKIIPIEPTLFEFIGDGEEWTFEELFKLEVIEDSSNEGFDVSYQVGPRDYEKRWIPVTERLPEKENRSYWVCTDTGYQCQCRWTNNIFGISESDRWGWSIVDVPQYQKVTAWMILPEPYEPSKEEDNE